MSGGDWYAVVVAVLLFLISVVLAVAETAFVRMSRIRAMALADDGRRGASRLAAMLEHPERTLNTVLLVVLVTQLTTASLVGVLLQDSAGILGIIFGITLQIVLFFVVGEVAPKTFAVQHTERAALGLSGLLWFLTNFWPLRMLSQGLIGLGNVVLPGKGLKQGPFVTEDEIRTMADVAASESEIEQEESDLIHSIFEFGDTVVREVMQPRTEMKTVEADATVDSALELAIEAGFSRLPVYEGSTDNIVGLVFLKDLVRNERSGGGAITVRASLRPAVFVPEQKRVAELLREMQSRRFHIAIVVDEYGGTAGLVTMEDLLEEIVGDITDEYDSAEPQLERIDERTLRVPGRTPIDEVSEALGIELPDTEWDTVSGLVFNLAGKVPYEGETVTFQNLEFRTERVHGRRIDSVVINVTASDEQPSPAVD